MKKLIIFCLLLPFIVFHLSCKKDKLTEFDIAYSTTLPVPAASYTANVPADFTTPEIPTQASSNFSSQKTAQDLITEIKMTRFNISTTSGNLNAIKSISIYLKTTGLGDVLVATKTGIPAGATSVSADLADVNIKEYIFKDKIQFRVNLLLGADSSSTARLFKMDQTVHVKAKLIK